MPNVVLMEPDAMFAAVLEDHLRVAGHQVNVVHDLSGAAAEAADMLILDGEPAVTLDALGTLRRDARTRSLPVLVLAADQDRQQRLAALRAGADDQMGRPIDLEEMMLRVERLLGRRTPAPQLAGDLAGHPLPDLLQYVQQTGKSGLLRVTGTSGRGKALFRHGQLTQAHWGNLVGQAAALAMLGLERGTFRFESDAAPDSYQADPNALPLQRLLLHTVWLSDELAARKRFLPRTGEILEAQTERPPDVDPGLDAVPIERVFARIRDGESVRIFDLIADEVEAPMEIRLAVAWLVEQRAVAPRGEAHADSPPPTTGEISSSMLFQINLTAFLGMARKAGLSADPLPLLIITSAGCRARIIRMLQGVHGYLQNEALRALAEGLASARDASTIFDCEHGRIGMHIHALADEENTHLARVVPDCGGVVLWLADGERPAAAQRIVDRLASTATRARGVVVAADPNARAFADELTSGHDRWQVTPHEPKSLLGILRLLEPA